jgi:hypothetical protein
MAGTGGWVGAFFELDIFIERRSDGLKARKSEFREFEEEGKRVLPGRSCFLGRGDVTGGLVGGGILRLLLFLGHVDSISNLNIYNLG